MTRNFMVSSAVLVMLIMFSNSWALDGSRSESEVLVRVISPRTGAEIPAGEDKVTIVVEVEDASEKGIKLRKGVPVFESPVDEKGETKQAVRSNLDAFLKGLVGVTRYTVIRKPGSKTATIYQLTSMVRTALLEGGCSIAVYPKDFPPGQKEVYASGYKTGARFEFKVSDSPTQEKKGDPFGPALCLVLPPGPEPSKK